MNGFKWRLLLFPSGNNSNQFVSLFLDVADKMNLPYGWIREAAFSLTLVSCYANHDATLSVRKETSHKFTQQEADWGFNHFVEREWIYDAKRGLLDSARDAITIEANISYQSDINPYQPYDSKKETGFVGLKNQGATCYMNSLLQTFYNLPAFRRAVYLIPTNETETSTRSIPLALQSLFYKMQFSKTSASTKELTRSFGWDTYESFTQHDILEFNQVLCEKLEDQMKGTPVQGTMEGLFECKIVNYIECTNVECTSEREETVRELQLVVKGCRNIYESLDKFCEVEMLDGDNKYRTENFGLQDARKGIKFKSFPPVLGVHLLRFEYDFQRDMMVKVNDKYEFPSELDLDRDNGKLFAKNAEGRQVRNLYRLYSVLVHSGGVHGGHYYAFVRPNPRTSGEGAGEWFRFDDEKVTKEDERSATSDQFGEDDVNSGNSPQNLALHNTNNARFNIAGKHSNAYMLVYVRESDLDTVFSKVDREDIPEHLLVRFAQETEERERKAREKAEAHLYTTVRVATEADMAAQIGKSHVFDLIDHDMVKSFRVQKQMRFADFSALVAAELGVPKNLQRFWMWAKRQVRYTTYIHTQCTDELAKKKKRKQNSKITEWWHALSLPMPCAFCCCQYEH